MDGELNLVGGEATGQPSVVPHWEGLVELGAETVEIRSEGPSRAGRIGDNEDD